jgi:hypothetical protein
VNERDQVYRERLVSLIAEIKERAGNDRRIRRLIGAYADRMSKDAGARNWADLKARADDPTYDSMLNMFQREAASAAKADDPKTVSALEVLGISLVGRHQNQADLLPGMVFLDKYIAESEVMAARANARFVPVKRGTRQ